MKKCTKCGIVKNQNEFFKDKQKSSGYRPDCKKCNIKKSSKWQKENKDKKRWYVLKNRTGLTRLQYEEILKQQDYKCAICLEKPDNKVLCVDHHHKDNMIRGLLCSNCNSGIGMLNDSIVTLNQAISYLKTSKENKKYEYKKT